MGRHSNHLVEGIDPQLRTELYPPAEDSGKRPVLLLHGFASSSQRNWVDTGWVTFLTAAGHPVITVDLPGHGLSAAPEERDAYSPGRIRADLLQLLHDVHIRPLSTRDSSGNEQGVDIIGYSLGARLAWEFGATQPQLVHRMVLGGPGTGDPLADVDLDAARKMLTDGELAADPQTAELMRLIRLLPSNDVFGLLTMIEAAKIERFTPSEAIPKMPVLLVAGDQDTFAATAPELVRMGPQVELLRLPGRTHVNAVTSKAFKEAAAAFLAAE